MATVAKGEDVYLQGDKSDVQLYISAGCPKRAHLMEVRTDLSSFGSIIPDDECFIAPVVDVLAPAESNNSSYILRIPHCLTEDDDFNKVKVRLLHEDRFPPAVAKEVPRGKVGVLFFSIDASYIELHTPHFCKVTCTICQDPYHCKERVINFCCARFESYREQHDVEVRPYFCSFPNVIKDFRRVSRYSHSKPSVGAFQCKHFIVAQFC